MKNKILFLCHGNICRSPMAEYILQALCIEAGVGEFFEIASAAVSTEETGNDIYPPAKRKLREHGIPFGPHAAHRITRQEFDAYDRIICADYANLRWLARIVDVSPATLQEPEPDEKVSLMMQWAGENRDVADPWYTGDFEAAYQDIYRASQAIMRTLSQTVKSIH